MSDQHVHDGVAHTHNKTEAALNLHAAYAALNDFDRQNRWFAIERAIEHHRTDGKGVKMVSDIMDTAEKIYAFVSAGYPGIEDPAS